MSHQLAERLSKETGYKIEWMSKIGCYRLFDGNEQLFPIYTKDRLLKLISSINQRKVTDATAKSTSNK